MRENAFLVGASRADEIVGVFFPIFADDEIFGKRRVAWAAATETETHFAAVGQAALAHPDFETIFFAWLQLSVPIVGLAIGAGVRILLNPVFAFFAGELQSGFAAVFERLHQGFFVRHHFLQGAARGFPRHSEKSGQSWLEADARTGVSRVDFVHHAVEKDVIVFFNRRARAFKIHAFFLFGSGHFRAINAITDHIARCAGLPRHRHRIDVGGHGHALWRRGFFFVVGVFGVGGRVHDVIARVAFAQRVGDAHAEKEVVRHLFEAAFQSRRRQVIATVIDLAGIETHSFGHRHRAIAAVEHFPFERRFAAQRTNCKRAAITAETFVRFDIAAHRSVIVFHKHDARIGISRRARRGRNLVRVLAFLTVGINRRHHIKIGAIGLLKQEIGVLEIEADRVEVFHVRVLVGDPAAVGKTGRAFGNHATRTHQFHTGGFVQVEVGVVGIAHLRQTFAAFIDQAIDARIRAAEITAAQQIEAAHATAVEFGPVRSGFGSAIQTTYGHRLVRPVADEVVGHIIDWPGSAEVVATQRHHLVFRAKDFVGNRDRGGRVEVAAGDLHR